MTFQSLINLIIGIIGRSVLPLIFAIAVVVFLYGFIIYLFSSESTTADSKSSNKGKSFMIFGVFGIFVMFAVWGFVGLLTDFIGVQLVIPQF